MTRPESSMAQSAPTDSPTQRAPENSSWAGRGAGADKAFRTLAFAAGIIITLLLGAVLIFLMVRAWPVLGGDQSEVSHTFSELSGGKASNFWGYVGPLLFGTVLIAAVALVIALFVSIGVSLFITFYAPKRLSRLLSMVVDLLAAIPSVIYGLWGSIVLVPATYGFWKWLSRVLGWIPMFSGPAANPPRTAATVALVLAVMIMPIIASMTRDLFQSSSQIGMESALALGATKWEMIRLAVLPQAKSGIVSAAMLALGRALGETMAVMMILSPGSSFSWHVLQASKTQTIAANIASQFPEANPLGVSALTATGLVLFVITFVVNVVARRITGKSAAPKTTGLRARLGTMLGTVRRQRKSDAVTSTAMPPAAGEPKHGANEGMVSDAAKARVPDFSKLRPSASRLRWRKSIDLVMRLLIIVAFLAALIPLISLLWTTVSKGIGRLNWNFLSYNMSGVIGGKPTPSGGHGGVEHAIIGTLEITLGAMVISVPLGLMCAVYITEYARDGWFKRTVLLLVNVMSGIPSIVAGLFAFSMFTLIFGPGTLNGFEGSVALSLLMIPTVVNSSVEMLLAVPVDLREASVALGVTKQRTITKVVLRTALPGIVSGVLLAVARVIGETAPLLMTAGFISTTNFNLFSGQMTTLPVYVYQEYTKLSVTCPASAGSSCVESIPMERAWAAALVLIVLVLLLNFAGRAVQRVFSRQQGRK